jgi:hypothetical protein
MYSSSIRLQGCGQLRGMKGLSDMHQVHISIYQNAKYLHTQPNYTNLSFLKDVYAIFLNLA